MKRLARLLLAFSLALPGCGDLDNPGDTTLALFVLPRPGVDAEHFTLPWPNDVRMDPDGTVSLDGFPAHSPIVAKYVEIFDRELRGWSSSAGIFFRFDGPIDPGSLPETAAHSLTSGATAYLLNIDPSSPELGQRTPVLCRFREAPGSYIGPNHLVLLPVPGYVLRPRTIYAAILSRGIRDARGRPLRRDLDLVRLLSATPQEDPALATAREAYAPLRSYLEERGIASTSVLNAAVFTTQAIGEEMAALREAVYRDMPAPDALPADLAYVQDATGYHVFEGTFEAPIYQAGEPPYAQEGGGFEWDSEGRPILQRTEPVRFALSVPSGPMPAAGWPVALYAHGTGGSFRSHLGGGVARVMSDLEADGALPGRVAVIGIDQVLHGTRCGDASCVPELHFFNFQNPVAARANVLQGALDNVQLLRFVEAMDLPSAPGTGAPLRFDPQRIIFYGHSQGSLTGPPFLAVEPKVPLAVLSGAGGNMILSLLQKTEPVDLPELLALLLDEPDGVDEFHPVLSLIQLFIDPADPVSYGRYIIGEPLPGVEPKHVFLSQGLIDHYVPPDLAVAFGASLGLALAEPQLAPADWLALGLLVGLPPASVDLALLEGFAPLERPVTRNLGDGAITGVMLQYLADEGRDGHFVLTDKPEAKRDWAAFVGSFLVDGVPTLPPLGD
ncbi:MAG: hypothetical protein RBU30_11970 [Polyangia bacterium]|jgi:hypothetical protein|nr:hypothetical protein [Polyangia bacterium]